MRLEAPLSLQLFLVLSIPPFLAGPSNFGENAEVGRGSDEDNSMLSRYGEKEDVEALAQRAMSRFDGYEENEAPLGK